MGVLIFIVEQVRAGSGGRGRRAIQPGDAGAAGLGREERILRDIAISSITITILSILPILMIMTDAWNTVVQYHSTNTLALLIVVVLIIALGFRDGADLGPQIARP